MTEPPLISVVNDLLATLPSAVVAAAEILAIPHWTDDATAVELVSRFTSANGTTVATVADVKRLPFVGPAGSGRWKIVSPVRDALVSRTEASESLARAVDVFLAERLSASAASIPASAATARELRWRAIYHRMSVEPKEAFADLDAFVERAASVDRCPTSGRRSS